MNRYRYPLVLGRACAFFLALTSSAYAEDDTARTGQRIVFGGKLGASIATQATEMPLGTNLDAGNKLGLATGVAATIGLFRSSIGSSPWLFAVQPEILFAAEGVNIDLDGDTLGAYHLNYLEIPLLARAGFRVARSIEPYVVAGPQFGILLTAELEDSQGEREDVKDGLKPFDVGLLFGAGVSLDLAAVKGALNLEARYDLGLTDINDRGVGGFVKNRAFFVLLGYQYGVL